MCSDYHDVPFCIKGALANQSSKSHNLGTSLASSEDATAEDQNFGAAPVSGHSLSDHMKKNRSSYLR